MATKSNRRNVRFSKNPKRPVKYNNEEHSHGGRYVLVSTGARDSSFLHNSEGKNEWPIVKTTQVE